MWRTTTVNWQSFVGIIVYGADLFGIFTTILFLAITQKRVEPVFRAARSLKKIDVFIPTVNEPLEIVEATVKGALSVRGISRVLLLDDGNRPEMASLAQRCNIQYFARTTSQFAKAGNMNNGLLHSDAEFILTLDADHVPVPTFLERTLGYFEDEKLAVVQTPQRFYNTDSFLFRKKWSEQSMFYECIQPAKNAWNSAFFVGTSALIRRNALDSVNGFATGTATEDIHTSLRLHAHGWKSLFVDEGLAFGLEAASVSEFYKQRRRWAAGSLGLLFRSPDSPLKARGLSLMQRLNYLSACLAHLQGAQRSIYFFAPFFIVFSGVSPIQGAIHSFLFYYLSFSVFSLFVTYVFSKGTYNFFYNESYSLVSLLAHYAGILGILKVQKKFVVSQKNIRRNAGDVQLRILLLFFVLNLVGLLRALFLSFQRNNIELSISVSIFSTINAVLLGSFLIFIYRYQSKNDSLDV